MNIPGENTSFLPGEPFPRSFFDRNPVAVSRDLIGAVLTRRVGRSLASGRIVEVEAYLAEDDPANHAFRGQTRRNKSMFGPPGHAYVYSIHTHHCLNFVTEPEGVPSAVLIRAVEPLLGIPTMARRRGRDKLRDLCRGPGRLCKALAIDRSLDGWDLTQMKKLWIHKGPQQLCATQIAVSPRIGVTSGQELPLRFSVQDSPFVSR